MIYTELVKFPISVHAFSHMDIDGNYIIFINDQLTAEQQKEAYDHEVMHIKNNDFDQLGEAEQKEKALDRDSNAPKHMNT